MQKPCTRCEVCDTPLAPASQTGRPRRYCSPTCRSTARRQRQRTQKEVAAAARRSCSTEIAGQPCGREVKYLLVVNGQEVRACARCYDLTVQYLIGHGVHSTAVEVSPVGTHQRDSSGGARELTSPSEAREPQSSSGLRVMLVEDDDRVRGVLVPALWHRGYSVTSRASGSGVLDTVYTDSVDVVLLDLGLPDVDGVTLLRQLRAVSDVPVIVVSARGEVDDRIVGLTAGADDYLVKPYDLSELVARIERVVRRYTAGLKIDQVYDDGVLRLDSARRQVHVAGTELKLTSTEFRLFEVLAHQAGAVQSVEKLLARVWDDPRGTAPERVKFAVSKLRRKLDMTDLSSESIVSARGVGYLYQPPDARRERPRASQVGTSYGHSTRVLDILNAQDRIVRFGDVTVDLKRQEVQVADHPVTLSRKEYKVLALLAEKKGGPCSREELMTKIWSHRGPEASRSLDIHIATLRVKLARPKLIQLDPSRSWYRISESHAG